MWTKVAQAAIAGEQALLFLGLRLHSVCCLFGISLFQKSLIIAYIILFLSAV